MERRWTVGNDTNTDRHRHAVRKYGKSKIRSAVSARYICIRYELGFWLLISSENTKLHRWVTAGGPGSGKVTHCDTLMEEKRGVTHINMMDLLHQHVISNGMWLNRILTAKFQFEFSPLLPATDMQDFSQLSSKMVTEVLMLEIKMAPAAKAYLISGFPRSMRDVVEYSDKVSVSPETTDSNEHIIHILLLKFDRFRW